MEADTLVLMIMSFAAFCWWMMQQLGENKKFVQENARKEQDRLARQERIKQIMNR